MTRAEKDMRDAWSGVARGRLTRMVLIELMEPLKHDLTEMNAEYKAGFDGKVAVAKWVYNSVRNLVGEREASDLLADALGGVTWQNLHEQTNQPIKEQKPPQSVETS